MKRMNGSRYGFCQDKTTYTIKPHNFGYGCTPLFLCVYAPVEDKVDFNQGELIRVYLLNILISLLFHILLI